MLNMFLELLKWHCGFSCPKHSIMLQSKSKIIAKTVHLEILYKHIVGLMMYRKPECGLLLFKVIRSLLVCIKHIHKSNFIITWCKGLKFLKDRKDLSVPEHRFIHVVITGVSIPKPGFYRSET